MAKVTPGIISLSGKIGKDVFVESRKYGDHVRKAPASGSRKDEPAFKEQLSRTTFLNKLAGELNSIIKAHSDELKSSRFYVLLQKRFRNEPVNNRFLLLQQLKGMEINESYPLSKLGSQKITVMPLKKKISVTIQVDFHPSEGKHQANCYCYEVLMISWDKSKKPAKYTRQFSEWVYLKKDKPVFEFEFEKTAGMVNWLLCLRKRLGVNETEIGAMVTDGMQIIDAGTFDKKEEKLLLKSQEAKEKKKMEKRVVKKVAENVVRVKAKK